MHSAESERSVIERLWNYCQSRNWTGSDPYDGLNSRVYQACRFLHYRYPRLFLIQALKRSPINFRPLLRVPAEQNAKGIALFLQASLLMHKIGILSNLDATRTLSARLAQMNALSDGYAGWGYNFDWQTRKVLVPRNYPNIICTTFAGNAFLDAFPLLNNPDYVIRAEEAARFLMDRLYHTAGAEACFSYYPLVQTTIHNANLLGAAFVARVGKITGRAQWIDAALRAARFSVRRQQVDGSWDYGESDRPSQRWKDNFHTGYNLCALQHLAAAAETSEFASSIERGFEFYKNHFFTAAAAPKYYHDRLYPIDIHSSALSIITLATLRQLDRDNLGLARRVFSWTVAHMRSHRGYFYFQKHPYWTIRTPHMRWSQAWMLLAIATLMGSTSDTVNAS